MSPLTELQIEPETPGWFNRADYFDILRQLRRDAPVYQYAPNSWVVTHYDEVRAISRDPERFCSGRGVLMNDPKRQGAELPGSILHMDPPEHAGWRKVASRWFTPKGVSTLGDRVRETATGLLDDVEAGTEIDFVESLAAPLPVVVIAELLGIGDADHADFRRWSDACIESPDNDDVASMEAVGELLAFLSEHVTRRRAKPSDDLLTTLVESDVDGRPLADDEIVMYCLSLLVAGNETTRHLLSGGALALNENPEQRTRLVTDLHGDPVSAASAAETAVEECLRWVTPIQSFARTATTDVTIGEAPVAEGDWVVLLYAAANRDESVFGANAESFDVRRPVNPTHLAFGFGEHLCLGASLARLEARIFITEFLRRFPDYEVTDVPTWTESTLVRGLRTLPLVLA